MMILKQILNGKAEVENQYTKAVKDEGNPKAVSIMNEYFQPSEQWRKDTSKRP
jgi:hydrogenase expression/formation protein HypD